MSRIKALSIGQRFGKWTVVSDTPRPSPSRLMQWHVRCECGAFAWITGWRLRKGTSRQCRGCVGQTHGLTRGAKRPALYSTWQGMLNRCRNSSVPHFDSYGGRGISVCKRWHDFENFLADMGERPSPRHSLDRIDVNGNYEPSNCRWATPTEQIRNRRNTVINKDVAQEILGRFEHGEPVPSISKRLGIKAHFVRYCVMGATHRDLPRSWIGRLPADL